jgi:hypothetical protein
MRLRLRFSPFGQSGGEFAGGGLGFLGGGRARRVPAHDDPFAVVGDHQQLLASASRATAPRVEGVEIGRGRGGELFGLAFAQPHPRDTLDGLDRAVERATRRFDRGQAAQPVRVLLDRQVQLGVGRVEVGCPRCAVGQALHADLAEHRRQCSGVPAFDPRAVHPVGIDHLVGAAFAGRPQIQMILRQLPHQLP